MDKIHSLHILIRSLSKAEKRFFRLQSNLQSGDKAYLSLFELLEKYDSIQDVYLHFGKSHASASFEVATKYLFRLILDSLSGLRQKQHIQAEIFNKISNAAILFERDLFDDAMDELTRAKKIANESENDLLLLLIHRTELQYLNSVGFKGISERELVNKQMKINEITKHTRNINMHTQLYDMLKHRLIYKGYIRSEKQKEALNDLVLSELHLISNSSYNGFEARKLHLLFQATYYLNSGNHKSAIRYYNELLSLFDENPHLLFNPPIYYLNAIHGILDSLHVASLYNEMPFFLSKLKEIEKRNYPTDFTLKVRVLFFLFESYRLIYTGESSAVNKLMEEYDEILFKKVALLNPEDQLKLHLHIAVFQLFSGKLNEARKTMKKITGSSRLFYGLPSYRTARLFNLILQTELGNHDFLENEISSMKKDTLYGKQGCLTEKAVFKFVQNYSLLSYEKGRLKLEKKLTKDFAIIENNKYEQQLLKIVDFISWIKSKLAGQSF